MRGVSEALTYVRHDPGSHILDDAPTVDHEVAISAQRRLNAQLSRTADSLEITNQDDSTERKALSMHPRVEALCQALNAYNGGSLSKEEIISVHRALFPDRGIPRFVSDVDGSAKAHSDFKKHDQSAALSKSVNLMQQFLLASEMAGSEASKVFQELYPFMSSSKATDILKKLLGRQSAWSQRNPATAKKNNIDVANVLRVAADALPWTRFLLVITFVIRHLESNSEFVASVSLWLTCIQLYHIAWQVLLNTCFWTWEENAWVLQCSLSDDESWVQLLYMQSLFGRGGTAVDWEQEFTKKVGIADNILQYTGHGWSATMATNTVRSVVRDVMSTAFPKAVPKPFCTFMDDAYEWLVSGFSAGIPSALRHSVIRDVILKEHGLYPRPTKRSVMETISREHILGILATPPKIVAKAHMKLNETGGKARAIYGVTIWHYIFSNWLMTSIELNLRHPNVDIGLPNSEFVNLMLRRANLARAGAIFSSYDYPDFNAMHCHLHMAIIYEEAKSLVMANEPFHNLNIDDQILLSATFDWMRDANFRQVVLHPDIGGVIQTCGGLYSGNRDTTLINTLLNIAYARIVDESLMAMQIDPGVSLRLCHGDDIVSVFRSYPTAVAWNEVAGWCRLKGQEEKLLTDRSYHEYLCIMGCRDGTLRGCLARCVSTFVNGNWETDRMVGLDQKAQELFSNIATMFRRGASARVCQALWYHSFRYFFHKIDALRDRAEFLCKQISTGTGTISAAFVTPRGETKAVSRPITYRKLASHVTSPYLLKILKKLPAELEITASQIGRMMDYLQQGTYGTELPLVFQDNNLHLDISQLKALSFNGPPTMSYKVKIEFESCLQQIQSVAVSSRIRRRIRALYTVLTCLGLPLQELARVLSSLTEADMPVVMHILELEGVIQNFTVIDFDAAAELKALNSALAWALKIVDPHRGDDFVYEIVHLGEDCSARPVREILRY